MSLSVIIRSLENISVEFDFRKQNNKRRSKAQVISLLYSLICDMENIEKDYLLRL